MHMQAGFIVRSRQPSTSEPGFVSSRHIFLANDVKRTLALYMYEASRRYEGAFIRVRLRVYERERERERERESTSKMVCGSTDGQIRHVSSKSQAQSRSFLSNTNVMQQLLHMRNASCAIIESSISSFCVYGHQSARGNGCHESAPLWTL